jgi:hypothetical protein
MTTRTTIVLTTTLALLAGGWSMASARGLDQEQVRAAVQTWVRQVTADARPKTFVERMQPQTQEGRVVGYVAHLSGGGYCLTGADDLVLPVYFYSPQGAYDPSDPNLRAVLDEIAQRTRQFTETAGKRDLPADLADTFSRRAGDWRDLMEGMVPERRTVAKASVPQRMDLPLTSQWNQDSPYNDDCPVLPMTTGPRSVFVGCVATCMAQIMRYWQWPTTGVGSHSNDYSYRSRMNWDEEPLVTDPGVPAQFNGLLDWTSATGGRLRMNGTWDTSMYNAARNISSDAAFRTALETLWNRMTVTTSTHSANFGATTYNWSIMPDQCTDPPNAGELEVAKLSEHLGIAFDMGWGVWFSGSDLWYAEAPFENHFRYDPDASYGPDDVDIMTEEIQWMRPFAFGGSTGSTAHAWVIFGYDMGTDPNRQFHMNMGWGGNNDGWYTLDNVPSNLTACCTRHLTHIAPQGSVRFVGNASSGDGSPDSPYRDIDEALQGAPDGTRLIFKAGSTNTFAGGSLVIDRPFVLTGHRATLQ